jgi:hypothetical protein
MNPPAFELWELKVRGIGWKFSNKIRQNALWKEIARATDSDAYRIVK